jgi:PhoH-like ATPase
MPRQFLIVDEAQNLTPHEVKTVLTRAGEGTKVVLTGDPMQIDNPYVDASSNGLTYVVERFKGSPAAGHVTLRKGERSELAELAATLL